MLWLIYLCMVLSTAGVLLLTMLVDGVIDLVDRTPKRRRRLELIDRNARAYGWAVGRGAPLDSVIESPDENPFHDPDWREQVES